MKGGKKEMKQKLLNIKSIKVDAELYPRNKVNWVTTMRYFNALTAGAIFPPITVIKEGRKYLLIDGAHRLEANKTNKEQYIEAEILENLSKKEIFIESVRRNSAHGLQFSAQETAKVILKLKAMKISKKEISNIVRISVDKIEPFVTKRMIRIIGSRGGEKGSEILKNSLKYLAGTDSEEINQDGFIGASQSQLIESLIMLVQGDLIDWDNKIVARKMKKLTNLLNTQFEE